MFAKFSAKPTLKFLFRSIVLSAVGSLMLFGQAQTGSLSGDVLDANQAAVPGATIEATNSATGIKLNTVSSEAGVYVFPNVPTGIWTVTAEKAGFKKLVRSEIQIFIAQRQALDLRLEIGDVKQSVEVIANQTLLDTDSAIRGQSLTPKMYRTLPMWFAGLQNPSAFLGYMAGVNSGAETSIAGSTGRSREQLIDGTSNVIPESGGTVFNPPSAESMSEVKLLVGTYTAEYGRVGGGIEIFTTKSGTNDIHGTWVYSMRRDIWNAAGWNVNSNRNNAPGFRPKERFNATGGGVGGPVYIPKVYNGRNKTFFYFSNDNDLRPANPASILNTVQSAAMRAGNFSGISQTIFDPATTVGTGSTATRTPFAGNTIPTSRFSRISNAIIPFINAPTNGNANANHAYVNVSQVTDHVWAFKIDHAFSDRNRVSYWQSWDEQLVRAQSDFDGPLGTALGQTFQKPHIYRINHDFVFSPTVLLHSTFGYSTTVQKWFMPAQTGFGSKFGFPGLTGDSDVTPYITFAAIDGFTNWGMSQTKVNNGGQNNYTPQIDQTLTVVKGKHEFKMGWGYRRPFTFASDLAGTNGQYNFLRTQTANPGAVATSGNSFASFLLGLPDSATAAATPVQDVNITYQYYNGFFQDNWRVRKNLTLNLGLRYEVPHNWTAPTMGSVSLTTPNPAVNNYPGAMVFPGAGPNRLGVKKFWPTDFTNLGPTAGFSWGIDSKTVLRGGGGIFYQATSNGGCGCTLGANGSFNQVSPDGLNAAFGWDGGIPKPVGYQPPPFLGPSVGNGLSVDYLGPTFGRAPRIYNWSLELQREIKGFLIEVGYAGNRARGLNSTIDLNQVNPSFLNATTTALLGRPITDPSVVAAGFRKPYAAFPDNGSLSQSLRPYPQFQNVWSRNSGLGKTWYESASIKVQRRFGDWQFQSSYVRSKTLGLLTFHQIFSQNQVYPQDMYNLTQPKSYLPFDQPNVFNFLSTYDLPFGTGKKLLNTKSRVLNSIVGGWTIGETHNYRSGALFALNCANTLGAGVLFTSARMCNATGSAILSGQERRTLDPNNPGSLYFNAPAFAIPSQFSFGTSSQYNSKFRQPPVLIDNISIVKSIGLWPGADGNRVRMQISANISNPTNKTNFAINGTVGNANFGRATAPQLGPRIIVLQARLYF